MSVHLGALVLCAFAGFAIAVQFAVNSELGKRVGVMEASAFSAAVSMTILLGVSLVARGGGTARLLSIVREPAWLWLGGLCGATALAAVSYAPPRLGAFATMAVILLVQLAAGLTFDAVGAFGLDKVPVDPTRIVGLVLLLAGTILLLRR